VRVVEVAAGVLLGLEAARVVAGVRQRDRRRLVDLALRDLVGEVVFSVAFLASLEIVF